MIKMMAQGTRLKDFGNGLVYEPMKFVVLGLSHANLEALKADRPIRFSGADLGLPDVEFFIFAGNDERSLMDTVKEFIGPETKVKIDETVSYSL